MSSPEEERNLEKEQEKEQEKVQEKEHEKGGGMTWAEKTRRDPLSGIIWPLILIWLGVAMMIDRFGLFDALPLLETFSFWTLFTTGAGLILLVEVAVRLLIPDYRQPVGGTVFLAVILISTGVSSTVGWGIVGPIALIGLGAILLLSSLMRTR
ncbi:MAG: hypothetical protein JXA97_01315 [Anaerolineales bacterium]|nr:hypothetical protein [Anaerolineales bacterium]